MNRRAKFDASSFIHLQRELATDHGFLVYDTVSKFDWVGFFIFGLVFVSRDFAVDRNVSCEESTVSALGESESARATRI